MNFLHSSFLLTADSRKNRNHSKSDSTSSVKTSSNGEPGKEVSGPVVNGISRETTQNGEMEKSSREKGKGLHVCIKISLNNLSGYFVVLYTGTLGDWEIY